MVKLDADKKDYVNSDRLTKQKMRKLNKMCPAHGIELTSKQFDLLRSPMVYLFLDKDDRPMYVGYSGLGISRPIDGRHHAVTADRRNEYAKVLIYPFKPGEERKARDLEYMLIRDLQPEYNVKDNPAAATPRIIKAGLTMAW